MLAIEFLHGNENSIAKAGKAANGGVKFATEPYSVLTAENGLIGLKRYQQHRETIDAVLLDMVMPIKSGLETYKELMAIAPECKVILASGFKEDARVLEVMELGADFFIQKPYTLQEISQVLADLLNA